MQIPDTQSDNLYKYVTILGVFLACTSIYSVSVCASSYGQRFREVFGQYLSNSAVDDEAKQVWAHFLVAITLLGLGMSVTGGCLRYTRIQRHQDLKHRLENEKLQAELPKPKRMALVMSES